MTLKNLAIFAAVAAVLYWLYKRKNAPVNTSGSPLLGTAPNPIVYDVNGNPVQVYSIN